MGALRSPGPQPGFTLIELLVTLSVMALVLALAVPSFASIVNGNKLASAANEMLASLQTARMEAISRNRHGAVCFSANSNAGQAATCANADIDGWLTFIDENSDGDFDSAGDTLLRTSQLEAPVQVSWSPDVGNEIVFRSDGWALTVDDDSVASDLLDGVVSFCLPTDTPAENARHVDIGAGSSITVSSFDGGGECDAPANP